MLKMMELSEVLGATFDGSEAIINIVFCRARQNLCPLNAKMSEQ